MAALPTEITSLPSSRLLLKELSSVSDWFMLGVYLKLEVSELRKVQAQFNSVERCKLEMFDIWLRTCPNASWELVASALNCLREDSLASTLRQKYSTPVMTPKHKSEVYVIPLSPREGLGNDLETLENHLARLIVTMQDEMDRKHMSVISIRRYAESRLKTGGKLNRVETIDELFSCLEPYYCFLNYRILEVIIEEYVPDLVHKMEDYKSKLNVFLSSTTVTDFVSAVAAHFTDENNENIIVVLKLRGAWLDTTLKHLKTLVNFLFEEKGDLLSHIRITRGSVLLQFQAPHSAQKELVNIVSLKMNFMTTIGIMEVVIGDKKIAVSSKQFSFQSALMQSVLNSDHDAIRLLLDIVRYPNKSLLIEACRKGDIESMELILKVLADAGTPLNLVLPNTIPNVDATNIAITLLHHGASSQTLAVEPQTAAIIHATDDRDTLADIDKTSPLLIAAKQGNVDMVSLLLQYNVDVNTADENGNTALIEACSNGNVEIVKKLLEANADTEKQNIDGHTAIMTASETGNPKIVLLLLKHGANPNAQRRDDGYTALMLATCRGHTEAVDYLLAHEADANAVSEDGVSALMIATSSEHKEIVELLIEAGADVDLQQTDGVSALMEACLSGQADLVELLLRASFKQDGQRKDGATALMLACANEHKDIVESLLVTGSDPDIQNANGETALMIASYLGALHIVELLLQFNTNINIQTANGETALMLACGNGQEEVVSLLLSSDALLNVTDKYGQTALFYAVKNGFYSVVLLLLECDGIDVEILDNNGHSVADIAHEKGFVNIQASLPFYIC